MPKPTEIEKSDEGTKVDGKALAIKLALMAGVTAASIVATNVVLNQIKKGQES